ncbi:phosphoribosylformylglycinamidine cyclo-ligase [Romboutsia lituseburensis]|uniref:Phosphoribosylformylglycinamidine cyclo-ligase n=1 Tax=Romboutsia lituseburensis DSM 797 TaxID=1121325 RepID=A0A1G9SEJ7_9FIRM|nr:phosphoribosylformylglycinamidine cyclo-ligase [Romboutsia lituseburensis]CEH35882.1 Phosphoribosylformylglycinamidine cyclo-ligase [Romboutsia lituseburensis]SDM33893.1 phosphoribosylformylglycinamidine cyclo-ligase [Romboutsia lituseburensis DSM 797]
MLTYKQSGVDIDEGNRAVDLIKGKIKSTYDNNVIGDLGNFSGLYSLKDFTSMKEPVLLSSTDGVGTKLKLAQMMDKHDTVGIDLVAMCVNDLICQGAKPLFFLDYIATGNLVAEQVEQIVGGIADGCKMAECALIGGETAEMPGMYSDDEYDLAGFSVGIADKEKIVSGQNVKCGDVLIGISSSGVHSNGYSFIRKIFLDTYNYKLDQYIEELGMTLGEALLTPTKIYVKLVLELMKHHEIKAIAHITGGGVIENIPRVIPKGLGIDINKNSWDKPAIFNMIEGFNAIDERELHKSFNMGIGLVLIVNKEDAANVSNFINNRENDISIDSKYDELLKDKAYIIGNVVDTHEGVNLC